MNKKEFKNLKVGDRVQLKNKRGENWNTLGLMDEYIGQVVTINELSLTTFTIDELGENGRRWLFNYKDIAQKVDDYLKVKCVDACGICGTDKQFTKGKMYERINGKLVDDNGEILEGRCMEDNPDEWAFCCFTKFKVLERYKSDDKKVDTVTETKPEVSEDIKRAYDDYMKVRCVKVCPYNEDTFTEGETYERINGEMTADDGFTFEVLCKSDDVSKWGFGDSTGKTEFELLEHYKNGVNMMKKDKVETSGSYLADAITALTRLGEDLKKLSDEPTVCPVCGTELNKVKEVKRPAKVGEWIKIVKPILAGDEYKEGDIFQVEKSSISTFMDNVVKVTGVDRRNIFSDEYVVLEGYEPATVDKKEENVNPVKVFIPHMEWPFGDCGVLGTKTKYKDAVGRELCLGDTVELYDSNAEYLGIYPIIANDDYGQFVLSIAGACDYRTGEIKQGFKVIKACGYESIADGEVIEDVKYIKTEPKKEPFKPHLVYKNEYSNYYGIIGTKTKFKDAVGRCLYVGDVVELYRDGVKQNYTSIVETDNCGQFVMGIQISCNGKTGKITNSWRILKVRSYEDVKNGEIINDRIEYIKTKRV